MEVKCTFEQLVAAVRRGDCHEELMHLIGPTEEENQAAQKRLEEMDRIWTRCENEYGSSMDLWPWHSSERYSKLMAEQTKFENLYC